MPTRKPPSLAAGDPVRWSTPQGDTQGVVTRKVTGRAKAGGHTAKASSGEPQYEVKSDKSGKTAIHRPEALRKAGKAAKAGKTAKAP